MVEPLLRNLKGRGLVKFVPGVFLGDLEWVFGDQFVFFGGALLHLLAVLR